MTEKSLTEFSRSLRRRQTDAEKQLWYFLRSRRLHGVKFRRQHPIGPDITDFCCLDKKVVIEMDGGQHAIQKGKDEKRTCFLVSEGFKVLRFWDREVFDNIEGVLESIRRNIDDPPSPRPSPLEGEGKRG